MEVFSKLHLNFHKVVFKIAHCQPKFLSLNCSGAIGIKLHENLS